MQIYEKTILFTKYTIFSSVFFKKNLQNYETNSIPITDYISERIW